MRYRELFEKYQEDKDQRAISQTRYQKILKFLYTNPPILTTEQYSYVDLGSLLEKHMYFILSRSKESAKFYVFGGTECAIALPYNESHEPTIKEFTYYWMKNRIDVIHELIHYDDWLRYKGEYTGTVGLSPKQYYNHGQEFNANYQELINYFDNRRDKESIIAFNHLEKFENFYDLMVKLLEPEIYQSFNVHTKKKLRKRLYQYWLNEIHNQVSESSENAKDLMSKILKPGFDSRKDPGILSVSPKDQVLMRKISDLDKPNVPKKKKSSTFSYNFGSISIGKNKLDKYLQDHNLDSFLETSALGLLRGKMSEHHKVTVRKDPRYRAIIKKILDKAELDLTNPTARVLPVGSNKQVNSWQSISRELNLTVRDILTYN